jgi:hypothetical protein
MIQQVNLYQDVLRREQSKSVNPYWLGLPAVAILLIGFSVNLVWNLKNTETEVQLNIKNLDAEIARVNSISSQIPQQEVDAQLAAEVAEWQNMLDELKQAMHLLSGKNADQSSGFSSYFQALSNQSIPDVWLSTLYIDGQQHIINLGGSTFKAEKIPYFLQQLQKEPVFDGHSFAKLLMQKSEKIPDQLDFKLTTTLEALDKNDHVQ